MKEQYLINFVIKGDNNVGKTSIIQQYSNNQLYNLPKSVNILDLSFKIMQLMESTFTIQIRNYKNSLSKGVKVRYLNADAIVLVYDVTKRTSFEWLNQEVQLINEIFYDNYPFICIIGNKEDLLERREVSKEEANKLNKLFETDEKKEELLINNNVISTSNILILIIIVIIIIFIILLNVLK